MSSSNHATSTEQSKRAKAGVMSFWLRERYSSFKVTVVVFAILTVLSFFLRASSKISTGPLDASIATIFKNNFIWASYLLGTSLFVFAAMFLNRSAKYDNSEVTSQISLEDPRVRFIPFTCIFSVLCAIIAVTMGDLSSIFDGAYAKVFDWTNLVFSIAFAVSILLLSYEKNLFETIFKSVIPSLGVLSAFIHFGSSQFLAYINTGLFLSFDVANETIRQSLAMPYQLFFILVLIYVGITTLQKIRFEIQSIKIAAVQTTTAPEVKAVQTTTASEEDASKTTEVFREIFEFFILLPRLGKALIKALWTEILELKGIVWSWKTLFYISFTCMLISAVFLSRYFGLLVRELDVALLGKANHPYLIFLFVSAAIWIIVSNLCHEFFSRQHFDPFETQQRKPNTTFGSAYIPPSRRSVNRENRAEGSVQRSRLFLVSFFATFVYSSFGLFFVALLSQLLVGISRGNAKIWTGILSWSAIESFACFIFVALFSFSMLPQSKVQSDSVAGNTSAETEDSGGKRGLTALRKFLATIEAASKTKYSKWTLGVCIAIFLTLVIVPAFRSNPDTYRNSSLQGLQLEVRGPQWIVGNWGALDSCEAPYQILVSDSVLQLRAQIGGVPADRRETILSFNNAQIKTDKSDWEVRVSDKLKWTNNEELSFPVITELKKCD
jgi:hypothetical protein